MKACLLFCLLSATLAAGVLMNSTLTGDEPPAKLLRHIVMYKFKAEATPAQVQEVIDTFSQLPSKIDTIVAFEQGPNVSEEGKSEGFTHCFVVTFRDQQGLATYLAHPAHAAYVNVVKDRREKVVVFDYWTKS